LKKTLTHSAIGPPAGEYGCIPYAILMRDDGSVLALALVASEGPNGVPVTVTFGREEAESPFVLRTEPWPMVGGALSFSTLSMADVLDRNGDADPISPPELSFEVVGLVRGLLADLDVAEPDALYARLALQRSAVDGSSRLVGAELVDPGTGRSLRQALWVEREGVPGGFFTPNGESLEPAFWTNPVVFRYISRGVGAASARRRLPADRSGRRAPAQRKASHAAHIGVDFVAPTGTPAVAVADGSVLFMGYFGGYGNLMIVEHAGGFTTHYGHLSAFASDLTVGAPVRRGTPLGYVGATGLATGSHLHFEIRRQGAYVDPLDHSQPLALWTLRRVDYATLARQVLAATTPAQQPSPEVAPTAPSAAADGSDVP
jgi:murein DD-endopeptidase MepM/ murein hydrolase activator NlpD